MVDGALVGAYRILHKIGEGGMGSVWLAEHTMLGRRAAIKVLHPTFSTQPEIVTRFFNEARAATAISDPGIVQIFDFGQHNDGSAYIVMELLEGETLDRRLQRVGRFGVGDALRVMRQVASSLGAAHQRGIVHRDLKPENIFLVRDGEVTGGERAKVVDFGIAKLTGDQHMKTQTSAVMGTPTYMSPEQCRGAGQVDQRSDVYALGCLLYTLVTGRPPFEAEGIGEIIAMHLREAPRPPSHVAPGIPPEIDQLVLCCLAKDPNHRFSSGADLAVALGGLLGSSPAIHAMRPSGPMPGQMSATPDQLTGPTGTGPGYPTAAAKPTTLSAATGASTMHPAGLRTRTRAVAIGGVAVLALGGIMVFAVTRGQRSDEPAAPAKPDVPAPTPPPTPPPTPTPPPPATPEAKVTPHVKDVLAHFVAWSKDHAGAACPDPAALGVTDSDPWSHPVQVTCTDQPANQIVGVISAGPDGTFGTADDIASWQLGHELTDVVRGARWAVTPVKSPPVTHTVVTKQDPGKRLVETKNPPAAPPATKPSHGVLLDENGIPIQR